MNEYATIGQILTQFRRSADQANAPFGSDAEFVTIGGQLWGMTLDDFSPQEDLFTPGDPERLGANLVVATLSDLLAAGVEPRFFLHALALPRGADPAFVHRLCAGMARILDRAGCALCGGDLGTADPWRYTGFALGPLAAQRPLMRVIPPVSHTLWISGPVGDLNVAAMTGAPTPELELRMETAAAVRDCAVAGIDTSGGLADALWMLRLASPGVRLEADLAAIPYAPGVREACAAAGIPAEAALFGGAGEYELVYALPAPLPSETAARLRAAGLTPFGRTEAAGEAEVTFVGPDGRRLSMIDPPPCPRTAAGPADHVREAIAAAARMLAGGRAP